MDNTREIFLITYYTYLSSSTALDTGFFFVAFLVLFLSSSGIPNNLFACVKYSVLGDFLVV